MSPAAPPGVTQIFKSNGKRPPTLSPHRAAHIWQGWIALSRNPAWMRRAGAKDAMNRYLPPSNTTENWVHNIETTLELLVFLAMRQAMSKKQPEMGELN